MMEDTPFTIAISPPVDRTGTAGHARLREYYGVNPGGNAPRTERRRSDDVNTNMSATFMRRAERLQPELRDKALAAHADYQAGMTLRELREKYRMAHQTFISQWHALGLEYTPHPPRPKIDRSEDAQAAHADRMVGYSMRYVMTKYEFGEMALRQAWRELGLAAPGNIKKIAK
jgi:hypothetical protein